MSDAVKHIDAVMCEKAQESEPNDASELDDLEQAFALLRMNETKVPAETEYREDIDARAKSVNPARDGPEVSHWTRLNRHRRYVVPALAASVFIALAAVYVVVRHANSTETAARTSNAVGATQLKLDYHLRRVEPQYDAGATLALAATPSRRAAPHDRALSASGR